MVVEEDEAEYPEQVEVVDLADPIRAQDPEGLGKAEVQVVVEVPVAVRVVTLVAAVVVLVVGGVAAAAVAAAVLADWEETVVVAAGHKPS